MDGRGARRAFFRALLASLLVAALLAPPAAAQGAEGEPIYTTREGLGYELYGDGTLVVVGDVVGSCDAVVREARPKGAKPGQSS